MGHLPFLHLHEVGVIQPCLCARIGQPQQAVVREHAQAALDRGFWLLFGQDDLFHWSGRQAVQRIGRSDRVPTHRDIAQVNTQFKTETGVELIIDALFLLLVGHIEAQRMVGHVLKRYEVPVVDRVICDAGAAEGVTEERRADLDTSQEVEPTPCTTDQHGQFDVPQAAAVRADVGRLDDTGCALRIDDVIGCMDRAFMLCILPHKTGSHIEQEMVLLILIQQTDAGTVTESPLEIRVAERDMRVHTFAVDEDAVRAVLGLTRHGVHLDRIRHDDRIRLHDGVDAGYRIGCVVGEIAERATGRNGSPVGALTSRGGINHTHLERFAGRGYGDDVVLVSVIHIEHGVRPLGSILYGLEHRRIERCAVD